LAISWQPEEVGAKVGAKLKWVGSYY